MDDEKRDIPTGETISHVASMTITRGGVPIATISTYTAAVVESDLDKSNLKVTGNVSSISGELGYLHLVWDFPKGSQTGEYECTVAAITDLGHFVTFTKSLTVQRSTLEDGDLINEIRDLKQIVTALNATDYKQLQTKIDQQQNTIDLLQSKTNIEATKISQLTNEVSSLKSDMLESKHVETGTISCGSSDHWQQGSGTVSHNTYNDHHPTGKEKRVSDVFKKQFSTPPVVFLSASYLVVNEGNPVWYGIHLVSVSTAGFTVRCDTWENTLVETLEIDWIAVPV